MKINNITALDYKAQGPSLELELTGTTLEAITGMDTALLTVQTDDGDLVEAFAGFTLRSVTFDLVSGIFRAELVQMAQDTTAAALESMGRELVQSRQEAAALREEVTTLQGAALDTMQALAELGGLVAAGMTTGGEGSVL